MNTDLGSSDDASAHQPSRSVEMSWALLEALSLRIIGIDPAREGLLLISRSEMAALLRLTEAGRLNHGLTLPWAVELL